MEGRKTRPESEGPQVLPDQASQGSYSDENRRHRPLVDATEPRVWSLAGMAPE